MIPATLTVLFLGLVASLALTPLVTRLAANRGWLDRPDGRRKLHIAPVPRIGGLSVYASFGLAFGLLVLLVPQAVSDGPGVADGYLQLLLASGAVAAIGLIDDLRGVKPWAKVLVQTGAALYLYSHGYQIRLVTNPFGGELSLGHFALPLTILWFVGMSNAFNLIDGLDGLAAGVAFFSTISLLAAAALNEHWATAFLTAALAGALLGFLRYNFSPASIFLGDCGSLFVGFALAAFAIAGSMKSSAAIAVAAPLLALALPIFDVMVSILRRVIRGSRLFEADQDHFHHRLLRLGLTPRSAVIVLYGVTALFVCLSLLVMTGRIQIIAAAVVGGAVVAWAGIYRLGYAELSALQLVLLRRLLPERGSLTSNVHLFRMRDSFRGARNLEQLWNVLVEGLDTLGFERAELVLGVEWRPAATIAAATAPQLRPFPVWRADGTRRGGPCTWWWSVSLGRGGDALGELRLCRRGSDTLGFDPPALVSVVVHEFGPGLRKVLCAVPAGSFAHGEARDLRDLLGAGPLNTKSAFQ